MLCSTVRAREVSESLSIQKTPAPSKSHRERWYTGRNMSIRIMSIRTGIIKTETETTVSKNRKGTAATTKTTTASARKTE